MKFRMSIFFQQVPVKTVVLLAMIVCSTSAMAQSKLPVTPVDGDVMHGWRIFYDKKCVECHSVWSQGGRIGPDLGRLRVGKLTEGQLAGIMWNHIPKMLGRMEQTGRPLTTLSSDEMADLFALIFFVRQLDERGDPVRGEEILRSKGCSECHSTDDSGDNIGPDLAEWGQYANPVIWAQMMWEHAPVMEIAMQRSGIPWPKLEGADLVHIVAYVRSAGISGEKVYLRPGSVDSGRKLFDEKKCTQCHPGTGPDLSKNNLPTSMGALASRMWNHSPAMNRMMGEQDVERKQMNAQELADILSYVLALGHLDKPGDPIQGHKLFQQKGCMQCHEDMKIVKDDRPSMTQLKKDATPVTMAAAMWNHGQTMLEQITSAGLSWPVFLPGEMVDVLAYLRSVGPTSDATDTGGN